MKSNIQKINLLMILLSLIIVSCRRDDNWEVVLEKNYSTECFKVLQIIPNLSGLSSPKLTWSIDGNVVSENLQLDFVSPYNKEHTVTLKVESNGTVKTYTSSVMVSKESVIYSKYISKVFDFRPAVGQFTNELPEYETGNSENSMIEKARNSLVGSNSYEISLGGFGGYVVFGFDHVIPNMQGRDFKILGNAFWAAEADQLRTGSCEPGIIMVAYDKNKNGKPDEDEWYEIAGSEHPKNTTVKNYSITYFKPNENKPPVKGKEYWEADVEYVKWQDNAGNSGYKTKNIFHNHNYYPLWISEASYTLTGTKLANNYYIKSGTETYWLGKSYDFGYADNAPNDDEASNIDISWAVDKNGNSVKLPGINFVKVYTGTNQEGGWLGEISTEISGAYDLYIK